MFLSVEISSYNRWHTLQRVLDGLAGQRYPADRFEVVVSDDGSTAETLEHVREYARHAPYPIVLLANAHAGCGPAHNEGISRARGDVVLMIADDIVPTPGLLEAHARMHVEHPEPEVCIVGRIEQSPQLPQTVFQKAWDRIVGAMYPRDRRELDYRDFWVNNLSFKRAFMLEHGMFRDWPAASHEDVELGYRLQGRGMRLLFCADALAFHHHPETIDSVTRRAYAHGYQWTLFEAHVPDAWVRQRSGNFVRGDSLRTRVRFRLRLAARTLLFNSLTVPALTLPLIRRAERFRWLAPLVPLLAGKVASYFFRLGIRDRRYGLPQRIH